MKDSYLKPLLPLRDIVIFPSMVSSSFCRERQINQSTSRSDETDKSIVLVTQKNSELMIQIGKDLFNMVV